MQAESEPYDNVERNKIHSNATKKKKQNRRFSLTLSIFPPSATHQQIFPQLSLAYLIKKKNKF